MLFTSNTKLENKFSKGESMQHEIQCDGVLYGADQTQSSREKFCETVKPPRPQTYCFNKKYR